MSDFDSPHFFSFLGGRGENPFFFSFSLGRAPTPPAIKQKDSGKSEARRWVGVRGAAAIISHCFQLTLPHLLPLWSCYQPPTGNNSLRVEGEPIAFLSAWLAGREGRRFGLVFFLVITPLDDQQADYPLH